MDIYLFSQFANSHCTKSLFGIESWNKYLDQANLYDGDCTLVGFEIEQHGWLIAAGILDILVRLAGFLAVVFLISGGFKYITSVGAPDKTSNALRTIINSLVGLLITMIASTTVSYIATGVVGDGSFGSGQDNNLGAIFSIVYGIAGAVSALMIVIGGFKYVTSGGDANKAASARQTIIYSLVGLVVVIFAATITSYVTGRV